MVGLAVDSSETTCPLPLLQAGRDELARWVLEILKSGATVATAVSQERDQRITWLEMCNKLEVFHLFEHGPDRFAGRRWKQADAAFRSVWLAERTGYNCAAAALSAGDWDGLRSRELPGRMLVPFHAGWGLALAEHFLERLDHLHDEGREWTAFGDELRRFVSAARHTSKPGCAGILQEALGLCARNLFPWLVGRIDRALARLDVEVRHLFWHGAGRAMYFAPMNFPPWRSAPWEAFSNAVREAPNDACRSNAIAGIGWAMCLVNLRHPEVMGSVLRHHRTEVERGFAFSQGVSSALQIWARSAPQDFCTIDRFIYHGESLTPGLRQLWKEVIAGPGATSLRNRKTPPEAFFRYACNMDTKENPYAKNL